MIIFPKEKNIFAVSGRKYAYTFLLLLLGSHQFEFLNERVEAMKREGLADASNVIEQLRSDAYLLYGAEYTDIRTTWN